MGSKRFQSSLSLVDPAGNEKKTQGYDDLGATKTTPSSEVPREDTNITIYQANTRRHIVITMDLSAAL